MTGIVHFHLRRAVRLATAALMAVAALSQTVMPAQAATERALYLYYTHTQETTRIVFKRNGQYVQSGLKQLNQFLRDWRRNEPAKMDPRLFDLIWEVYQEVGATQPINIVSAYRSPATNEMLRSKPGSGVAENSQHTKGHAMDFFIPGIPLTKLRAVAMKKQVGGVGYYPTSGSPFVHLDTGSVRAWPRMTRAQLAQIFPDGKTAHLPTDGKPLSQKGYQMALAEWKQCHEVPCGGSDSGTRVASGGNLMDMLFGGNQPEAAPTQPAPVVQTASLAPQAQTSSIAPMPLMRPADLGGTVAVAANDGPAQPASLPFSTAGSAPLDAAELRPETNAPVPASKSERLRVATAEGATTAGDAVTAIAALTEPPVPQPRVLMSDRSSEPLSAYLPTNAPDPQAQKALEAIIAGTSVATAQSMPPAPGSRRAILPSIEQPVVQMASLGNPSEPRQLAALFDATFRGTVGVTKDSLAQALARHVSNGPAAVRQRDLVAPDLEHVTEVLTTPVALTSEHFAAIYDHDEADFDPTPEMGQLVTIMAVGDDTTTLSATRFVRQDLSGLLAN